MGTATNSFWACLTRRCNFACTYCYQGDHADVPAGLASVMSEDVLEKGARWCAEWTRQHVNWCWYGGEPLLAWQLIRDWTPRIREMFDAAKKTVRFSITTNGSLLQEEQRAFLDAHDVGVLLSLDGPKDLHNLTRLNRVGGGTWDIIPLDAILKWRPEVEVAWQLSPNTAFSEAHLDEMIARGFKRIAFNIDWLRPWPEEAQSRLRWFMKAVALRCADGRLSSNWWGRLEKALNGERLAAPCGTGLYMVGLSPEGWLYPSQEMVYTTVEPGRAPGTDTYYRIGDVNRAPVLDMERLGVVSTIKTDELKPKPPYNCATCVAAAACVGGCHCRYVGNDGMNPANRFDVPPAYCASTIAAVTGMLMGASVARKVSFTVGAKRAQLPVVPAANMSPRVTLESVAQQLAEMGRVVASVKRGLDELPVVRIEREEQ